MRRRKLPYILQQTKRRKTTRVYAIFSKDVPAKKKFEVPNLRKIPKFTSRKKAEAYRKKYLERDTKVLRIA